MTTDPTYEDTYDPTIDIFQMMKPYRGGDSFHTIDPAGVIDAWLRATVACPQCQGTGTICGCERCKWDPHPRDIHHTMYGDRMEGVSCHGPHTKINIERDCGYDCEPGHLPPKVLYADADLIEGWSRDGGRNVEYELTVPLPSGWTVT